MDGPGDCRAWLSHGHSQAVAISLAASSENLASRAKELHGEPRSQRTLLCGNFDIIWPPRNSSWRCYTFWWFVRRHGGSSTSSAALGMAIVAVRSGRLACRCSKLLCSEMVKSGVPSVYPYRLPMNQTSADIGVGLLIRVQPRRCLLRSRVLSEIQDD
ncbi:hypothetical protein KC315_g32 [Hortaea werneckii]|nr:hypothetical protein KC315_g32 [Hortaea werneckii]